MNLHRECSQCGVFSEMSKGGGYLRNVCKPCWNKQQKAWRMKNKQRWSELQRAYAAKKRANSDDFCNSERARSRKYWFDLRQKALDTYGRQCACCGESIDEFLTIDHMDNDGAAHRRTLKTRGAGIWKWLRDNSYPSNFQTLCMNCNLGKHKNGGVCPHQKLASKIAV